MGAKSLQSCLMLCDPMDCSPPGSSLHGILRARILEQVAIPFSRGSSQSRDETHISCVSCIGRQVLYHWHHPGSPHQVPSDSNFPTVALSNLLLCKSREFERTKEFCPVEEGKRLSTLLLGSFLLYKLKFKIVILTAEDLPKVTVRGSRG